LDDFQHRHIPYFVILIKVLNEWKATHNNKPPSNFNEKAAFIEMIKSKSRLWKEEENFQEAVKFAHKSYANPSDLPVNIQKLF